jgi:hypothetical protein
LLYFVCQSRSLVTVNDDAEPLATDAADRGIGNGEGDRLGERPTRTGFPDDEDDDEGDRFCKINRHMLNWSTTIKKDDY